MPAAVETISSIRNPLLKEIRRALQQGSLTDEGLCVVEGRRLLDEALRGPAVVEAVLAPSWWDGPVAGGRKIDVADVLLAQVASTETSPGVISLIRPRRWTLDEVAARAGLIVVLDGLQDPGNAGTIVRSAEAFGAGGVVFLPGSAGIYNPKLMRASAGSCFRLPLSAATEPPPLRLLAAYAHSGADARDFFRKGGGSGPCALVIGHETRGIRPELAARAERVRIPTSAVESLNAAVSASLLLYEASLARR